MDQLEDEIAKYRGAARNTAIGLGAAIAGFTFEYGLVDDLMRISGGFTIGWNIRDTITYIRYSLKYRK